MIEGLRGIFFFGKGLSWSTPVTVLVWIGAVSMVIILMTAFKRSAIKEHKTELTLRKNASLVVKRFFVVKWLLVYREMKSSYL